AGVWARCAGQAPAGAESPGDLQEGAGALAAWIFEAGCLVNDQHVEQRMIVGKRGELANQPWHEVDANHRHLARRRGTEARPALFGTAVEDGDTQMRQMIKGRDLGEP